MTTDSMPPITFDRRKNAAKRARLEYIICELREQGPEDLVAKEVAAGLRVMRIQVDVQTIRRIWQGHPYE